MAGSTVDQEVVDDDLAFVSAHAPFSRVDACGE